MRLLSFIAGFGLFWPMLRRSFFSQLLARSGDPHLCYILFTIVALLATLVLFLARTKLAQACSSAPGTITTCAVSLSLLAAGGIALADMAPTGFVVSVAMGVEFPFLIVLWGQASLVLASKRRALAFGAIIGSFIVGFLVSTLLVPIEHGISIILGLLPAFSAVLWRACWRRAQVPGGALSKLGGMPLIRIAILGTLLVVASLIRGLYYGGSILYDPAWDVILPHVITTVTAVVLLLYVRSTRHIDRVFKYAMIVSSAPLLIGLLLSVYGVDATIGAVFVTAGKSCFELVLWLLLADAGRDKRISSPLLFSLSFALPELLASLGSYVLVPLIAGYIPIHFSQVIPVVALVTTALFVAGCFAYLMADEPREANRNKTLFEGADERAVGMPSVIWMGNSIEALTPREVEIAGLLAEGNTYRSISDTLDISVGTVQSHAKSVYRKLGVHTKQELIDLSRSKKGD